MKTLPTSAVTLLAVAACALPVVGGLSSCAECEALLDCPFGEVCTADGKCVPEPGPRELPPCEVSEDSPLLDPEQGFLDDTTIWQCPLPISASGGEGLAFTGV